MKLGATGGGIGSSSSPEPPSKRFDLSTFARARAPPPPKRPPNGTKYSEGLALSVKELISALEGRIKEHPDNKELVKTYFKTVVSRDKESQMYTTSSDRIFNQALRASLIASIVCCRLEDTCDASADTVAAARLPPRSLQNRATGGNLSALTAESVATIETKNKIKQGAPNEANETIEGKGLTEEMVADRMKNRKQNKEKTKE
ncbi:hypothetical protein BJ742DRAFT_906493 [Cladochytrium replicatum]|nr:hypothetical protein BJ742DRAFT_906493 [Cladochytrium replicatum]